MGLHFPRPKRWSISSALRMGFSEPFLDFFEHLTVNLLCMLRLWGLEGMLHFVDGRLPEEIMVQWCGGDRPKDLRGLDVTYNLEPSQVAHGLHAIRPAHHCSQQR